MRKEFHGILFFNIRGWSQAWSVTSKVTVFSSLFWFCINDNRVRWLLRCIEHLLSTRNRTWFFMRLITLKLHNNLSRAELLSPRVTPSWSGTRSVLFTTRITFLMIWHVRGLWISEAQGGPNVSSTYYVLSTAFAASHLSSHLTLPMRKMVQKLVRSRSHYPGLPWM